MPGFRKTRPNARPEAEKEDGSGETRMYGNPKLASALAVDCHTSLCLHGHPQKTNTNTTTYWFLVMTRKTTCSNQWPHVAAVMTCRRRHLTMTQSLLTSPSSSSSLNIKLPCNDNTTQYNTIHYLLEHSGYESKALDGSGPCYFVLS